MGDIIRRRVRMNESAPAVDYATTVGQSLIDRLVTHVVDNGVGIATNNNPVEQVQQVLSVAKDLAGVSESRERRLTEEIETLRDKNNSTIGEIAQILSVLLPAIKGDSNSTLVQMVIEMNEKHNREMRELIKELSEKDKSKGKDEEEDFFKNIGKQILMSKLESDPKKEFEEQISFWSKFLADKSQSTANVIDFEKWKFQKQTELEQQKINLELQSKKEERELDERKAERQSRMLENLALAVAGMASKSGSSKEEIEQAVNNGMYLVKCPHCNDEFVLTQPRDNITCPFCRSSIIPGQMTG